MNRVFLPSWETRPNRARVRSLTEYPYSGRGHRSIQGRQCQMLRDLPTMAVPQFRRLVRFVPKSDPSNILIGEPSDETVDVGKALREGTRLEALRWTGSTVLSPGSKTDRVEIIHRVLSPLASNEVGTIRCIGLNVRPPPSSEYC